MLTAVIAASVWCPRASEACSGPRVSIFDLFDGSQRVAVVDVRTRTRVAGFRRRVPVGKTLRVRRALKGARPGDRLRAEPTHNCQHPFVSGTTVLVFLDEHGRQSSWFEALVKDYQAPAEALARWSRARSDADRAAVLVPLVVAPPSRDLAIDAALALTNSPGIVMALTESQIAALTAAVDRSPFPATLALGLARLRVRAPVDSEHARQLIDTLLDNTQFETVSDPETLARAIETTTEPGVRIAALERCERVHRRRLDDLTFYVRGLSDEAWTQLAKACRTGVAR